MDACIAIYVRNQHIAGGNKETEHIDLNSGAKTRNGNANVNAYQEKIYLYLIYTLYR